MIGSEVEASARPAGGSGQREVELIECSTLGLHFAFGSSRANVRTCYLQASPTRPSPGPTTPRSQSSTAT